MAFTVREYLLFKNKLISQPELQNDFACEYYVRKPCSMYFSPVSDVIFAVEIPRIKTHNFKIAMYYAFGKTILV